MISGIATIDISDHLPSTISSVLLIYQYKNKKSKRFFRDYRQFDSELYLQEIKAIDRNTIYIESNGLNEIAAKTISILQLI